MELWQSIIIVISFWHFIGLIICNLTESYILDLLKPTYVCEKFKINRNKAILFSVLYGLFIPVISIIYLIYKLIKRIFK